MLSPAILFTAITIVCPISKIFCNPNQEVELQRLLELAQQQSANRDREVKGQRYDSIEVDRNEDRKRPKISELVHLASQIKDWPRDRNDDFYKELNENKDDDGWWYGYQSNIKNRDLNKDDFERFKRSRHNEDALEQLLSQSNLNKKHQNDKYKDDDERFKHSRYNEEALEQLLSQNVLDKKYEKDDEDNNKYSHFNEEALEQLLSQVLDKNQKRDKYKDDDERFKHSRYNEEALEQLLSENVLDKKFQGKPRHKLVPNNLVGSFELKNNRAENRNNLGAYSKVYVILNPKAIAKSTNKEKLNDLLTKILSLTSSSGLERENKNRENTYKGFSVLPELLSRRSRRESREMYTKDSIEEDYKPKRPRSERGGGGGGMAGGRTAIPYIRHRGDIYERDN